MNSQCLNQLLVENFRENKIVIEIRKNIRHPISVLDFGVG